MRVSIKDGLVNFFFKDNEEYQSFSRIITILNNILKITVVEKEGKYNKNIVVPEEFIELSKNITINKDPMKHQIKISIKDAKILFLYGSDILYALSEADHIEKNIREYYGHIAKLASNIYVKLKEMD